MRQNDRRSWIKLKRVGGVICYTIKVSTYNEDKFISAACCERKDIALFSVGLFHLLRTEKEVLEGLAAVKGRVIYSKSRFATTNLRLTELLDSWAGVGRRATDQRYSGIHRRRNRATR